LSLPPWLGRLVLGQPLPQPPGELNIVSGTLPSTCQTCLNGGRLILTLGERCPKQCFYCSNPSERSDRSTADDLVLRQPADAVRLAKTTPTTSLCLTGGEPTWYLDRAMDHIRRFRRTFGSAFHVHFFTGRGRLTSPTLRRLHTAGVNEIRFHASSAAEMTGVGRALEFAWDVAVEVPALPEPLAAVTLGIVEASIELGVAFVNLHELLHMQTAPFLNRMKRYQWEVEEPLYIKVPSRKRSAPGLLPGDVSCRYGMPRYAIRGSRDTGLRALELPGAGQRTAVHFCTAASKYFVQVPQRLAGRARSLARPYEQVSPESTLIHALLKTPSTQAAAALRDTLMSEAGTGPEQIRQEANLLRLHPEAALRALRRRSRLAPDAEITFCERYPAPDGSRLHPQMDFLEFPPD
jgi:pyruvate formate-lyase activating enzyme-like uncharacterized protein